MIVGWLDSPHFDAHRTGVGHPERPARLATIREAIAGTDLASALQRTEPAPAPRPLLEAIHRPAYLARLEAICAGGGGQLDPDTAVVEASWQAALLAAGAVVDAAEGVLGGLWQRAFCSVRPPGHHAESDTAMGFCLLNNVAVGAEAARRRGVERVAIVDWDVHHGNGTQQIFWQRADVLYASLHQYPYYPGTGAADEVGAGPGRGTTVNCPLAAGSGDAAYLQAWNERIRPALEAFAPELLFISAGFDADYRDPLAGLEVTTEGFARLSAAVVAWADAHCGGRVVSVLEGGYDLDALAEDVVAHVETMC